MAVDIKYIQELKEKIIKNERIRCHLVARKYRRELTEYLENNNIDKESILWS